MSDASVVTLATQTAGISARLSRLRRDLTIWLWVHGLARWLWLALALIAADVSLDWLFRMDRSQRGLMLALLSGALAYAAYLWLWRPLSASISDDALCLQIEAQHGELGQSLISALQLARMENLLATGMSPTLVAQTVRQGTAAAAEVPFSRVLNAAALRRSVAFALLGLTVIGSFGYGAIENELLATGLSRNLLLSDRNWPQQTHLMIRGAVDGKVLLPRGKDWNQVVTVTHASRVIPALVHLDWRGARGRTSQVMKPVPGRHREFIAVFAGVIEPFEFRARGGDATTPWVRVELVEPPAVESLTVEVTPPRYTGEGVQTLHRGEGPYYVLRGSLVKISGVTNKPLSRAAVWAEDKSWPLALSGPQAFSGEFDPLDVPSAEYAIDLQDTSGLGSHRPVTFGLRIRADREPRVQARTPGVGALVVPRAQLPLACRITDDFGVVAVRATYEWHGNDAEQPGGKGTFELPLQRKDVGCREIALDARLELEPLGVLPGSSLQLHVAADDNDDVSGPHTGQSAEMLFRVVSEDELRSDLLRREKEQRQEFERLLSSQEDLLTDTRALEAAVATQGELATEHREILMQSQRREKQLATNVATIAHRVRGFILEVQCNRLEAAHGRLEQRLDVEIALPLELIAGEGIPQAIQRLDQVRRLSDQPRQRDAALAAAIEAQSDVVQRMKRVLARMSDAEGFQEAVNMLYEIQQLQQDVLHRTLKAQQERVQSILEGKSP